MMRFFLTLTILFFTWTAQAQTPIDKDGANRYFANCTARRDERMSTETQEALCSCTSVKMMENMTVEDIQIMAQNTEAGRAMLNKMLLDVYAPCIQYPAADLVVAECMSDEKLGAANLNMSRSALCHCMANATGTWLGQEGRTILDRILRENPNITDPISPVMDSPEFRKTSFETMTRCINEGQ